MGIREDRILHHEIKVHQWTPDERFAHLCNTFDLACGHFPEVMDPYTVQLADLTDRREITAFIRNALRETFWRRWPSKLERMKEAS
ncbi:hypothetical protein [Bradyrhizobium sp. SZCCHNS1012]|uniref:hypothetical protein n=1 Tax=Bradyrhizobium sp. SZCCHNS1012 TaxID=3057297 RepID=UPI002916C253|nr:hypothetical protein [Bradyrhizobium sp. SZCCHNS1012]